MELPLFRLYLRRLLATPTGLPLRDALRTARVRALLAVLGWTVAATLTLCAVAYVYAGNQDPTGVWLEEGGAQLLIVTCTLAGVWYLLFLPAEVMASLARQGKSDAPDWYASPLDSSRAVLSTLLAALLAALPAAAGLALYLFFTNEFTALQPDGGSSLLTSYHHVDLIGLGLSGLGVMLLRLPAYILFTGCLSLALRRHSWGPYVPALAALAGAALTQVFGDSDAVLLNGPAGGGLAAGAVLLLLGLASLPWLARRTEHPVLGGMVLLAAVGLPLLSALAGFASPNRAGVGGITNVVSAHSTSALPPRALVDLNVFYSQNLGEPTYDACSALYPIPDENRFVGALAEDFNRQEYVFGLADDIGMDWTELAADVAGLCHALVLVIVALVWYATCCRALDGARNILRRSGIRMLGTRSSLTRLGSAP